MKRIFIAIMSLIVGAAGYTIVDKTIETRVADLENRVSQLESIVEVYHYVSDTITTTFTELTTQGNATTSPAVDDLFGEQLLGYRYDTEGGFYYTDDKECWQKNAGFNEIYDTMTPLTAMYIDCIRVHFTYDEQDWMFQLWKGQYGYLLIGSEIGVYTAPTNTHTGDANNISRYKCADKEDWLKMDMTCYWKENNQGSYKKTFHREYTEYWWCTGFVKGQLTKYTTPRTELKVMARITFKSEEMASLFAKGLADSDFISVSESNQLTDDSFCQNGADVQLIWLTKNHNVFVEYED